MEAELASMAHMVVNRPPTPEPVVIVKEVPVLSDEQMAELQSQLDKLQEHTKQLEAKLHVQTSQRRQAELEIIERQEKLQKAEREAQAASEAQERKLEALRKQKEKLALAERQAIDR